MTKVDRRTAMSVAATSGLVAAAADADAGQETTPAEQETKPADRDRGYVMAAGMTAEEADCWKQVAAAAGSFFKLPVLHPMDKQEVASAIHIIQNKLLGRPTYRKYLELAKAGAREKRAGGEAGR